MIGSRYALEAGISSASRQAGKYLESVWQKYGD
jgi:hypothetical protein